MKSGSIDRGMPPGRGEESEKRWDRLNRKNLMESKISEESEYRRNRRNRWCTAAAYGHGDKGNGGVEAQNNGLILYFSPLSVLRPFSFIVIHHSSHPISRLKHSRATIMTLSVCIGSSGSGMRFVKDQFSLCQISSLGQLKKHISCTINQARPPSSTMCTRCMHALTTTCGHSSQCQPRTRRSRQVMIWRSIMVASSLFVRRAR